MKDNKNVSTGIGFFGILQAAFIILKVLGLIKWSWVLVFIPSYIYIGLVFLGFIALTIFLTWSNKK